MPVCTVVLEDIWPTLLSYSKLAWYATTVLSTCTTLKADEHVDSFQIRIICLFGPYIAVRAPGTFGMKL